MRSRYYYTIIPPRLTKAVYIYKIILPFLFVLLTSKIISFAQTRKLVLASGNTDCNTEYIRLAVGLFTEGRDSIKMLQKIMLQKTSCSTAGIFKAQICIGSALSYSNTGVSSPLLCKTLQDFAGHATAAHARC